jgi:hypothetical protein
MSLPFQTNMLFNLPIALMILSCLILLGMWIDIYSRCIEIYRTNIAPPHRFVRAVLSKPFM